MTELHQYIISENPKIEFITAVELKIFIVGWKWLVKIVIVNWEVLVSLFGWILANDNRIEEKKINSSAEIGSKIRWPFCEFSSVCVWKTT